MTNKNEKNMNFEEALKELEDIASKLSKGNLPLDESIKLFERGMTLKKFCEDRLKEARKKIKVLVKKDGKLKEENFIENENE